MKQTPLPADEMNLFFFFLFSMWIPEHYTYVIVENVIPKPQ